MKDNIYEFVKEYVSYFETSKEYKLKMEKVTENCKHKQMIEEIRLNDSEAYSNILRLEDYGVLYEYSKFMLQYFDKKRLLRMDNLKIAELTKVPLPAVRRFENLQDIAPFSFICAIGKSVNLTITWQ